MHRKLRQKNKSSYYYWGRLASLWCWGGDCCFCYGRCAPQTWFSILRYLKFQLPRIPRFLDFPGISNVINLEHPAIPNASCPAYTGISNACYLRYPAMLKTSDLELYFELKPVSFTECMHYFRYLELLSGYLEQFSVSLFPVWSLSTLVGVNAIENSSKT